MVRVDSSNSSLTLSICRIERDLHDGAQQRLVTLAMGLGLTRIEVVDALGADHPRCPGRRRGTRPGQGADGRAPRVRPRHPPAGAHRRGVRGRDRSALRPRMPLPVEVAVHPRPPAARRPVESTAYFAVSRGADQRRGHTPGHAGLGRRRPRRPATRGRGTRRRAWAAPTPRPDSGLRGWPTAWPRSAARSRSPARRGAYRVRMRIPELRCRAVVLAEDRRSCVRAWSACSSARLRGRRRASATPTRSWSPSPSTTPTLVVTDIRMPPAFTDEGLRAALPRRAHPGVPVLVLSQYVERSYAAELLDSAAGRASATCSRTAWPTRRLRGRAATGRGRRHRRSTPTWSASCSRRRRRPARPAHRARARGPRADGRGPLERGHRGRCGHRRRRWRSTSATSSPSSTSRRTDDDNRRVLAVLTWLRRRD